jgi:hypothetical protein
LEKFKIEKFKAENSGEFPPFTELNESHMEVMYDSLHSRFQIPIENSEVMFTSVMETGSPSPVEDLHDSCWLKRYFKHPEQDVYIIWDKDAVDLMSIESLIKYWNFLWYDVSDEAVILYSPSDGNMVLVCHWSVVYALPQSI